MDTLYLVLAIAVFLVAGAVVLSLVWGLGNWFVHARTRQWAPLLVLALTYVFAWVGYRQTGDRSWPWTIGGLVVGVVAVLVVDRIRHRREMSRAADGDAR